MITKPNTKEQCIYLTEDIKPFKNDNSPKIDTSFSLNFPVELNKLYKIEMDLLAENSTSQDDKETLEITIRPPAGGKLHIGHLTFWPTEPDTEAGIKTIKNSAKRRQRYKVNIENELGSSRWKYSEGLFFIEKVGLFEYPDNNDSVQITISVTHKHIKQIPDFTLLAGSLFSLIEIDAQPYEEEEES